MATTQDYEAIAALCRSKLDLRGAGADFEWYLSLPLCIIDTVFSIGALYTSTRNTVLRFCTYFGLRCFAESSRPPIKEQFSVSDFLRVHETHSLEFLAQTVYQNSQRTSTRNGILKADAALRVARVLQVHKVDFLQDVDVILGNPAFETDFQQIPGQSSGVSLRYFYILTGSSDYVKPDRMILRFIQTATGRLVSVPEAQTCIVETSRLLQQEYPALTPALLDNLIWQYQRSQAAT